MTSSTKTTFDYQGKDWGVAPVTSKYTSLQGLDLVFFDKITASLNKKTNMKVLDLGCGGGNIDGYLKDKYPKWDITGIDISQKIILSAKKNYSTVKFIKADAKSIPFKSGSLDLVYGFDTLEHFEGLPDVLSEVSRVLKNGGHFYVAIPLEKQFPTVYWLLNKFGWTGKRMMSGHINTFNYREFTDFVESHGFKLLKKRFSYHFFLSITDVFFYLMQTVLNRSIALETSVSKMDKGIWRSIMTFFKNTVSVVGYIESSLFWWLPGGKGHFLFVKENKNDFFSSHPPLTVAEDYQQKYGLKKAVQPRDIEISRLLKKLEFAKAKTVLDFGCADGIWLERILAGTNKKGTGVDIAPKLIEIAKQRKGVKGRYLLTNTDWRVPQKSIDFCFSFDTFEHIKNKTEEVAKLSKSIKSGGKILIYTLNPNNKYTIDWIFEKFGSDYMYKRADHDKKIFISPKGIGTILSKYGFKNAGYELYDGPANLVWRVISFTSISFIGRIVKNKLLYKFIDNVDMFLRLVNPLNNFIDGFFLRRGYSNGYFLWAEKT